MTQQQEFHAEVGQAIQTSTLTQIHQAAGGRKLTAQERKALNAKVTQLVDDYGEPGWQTWRTVHQVIGVDNIEAMRQEHLESARAILDLMLERAALSKKLTESKACEQALCAAKQQINSLAQRLAEQSENLQKIQAELLQLTGVLEQCAPTA